MTKFLTTSDVRICPKGRADYIIINASDEKYDLVKSLLTNLKDATGLRIDNQSEESAAFILTLREQNASDGSVIIKTDVAIPRTNSNEFIVVAWKNNIRGAEALNQLSEELKEFFENYELTVKVFPC